MTGGETWTIRLELTITVDELMANSDLSPNAHIDDQRDEVSGIAHQWGDALEQTAIPHCNYRVLASRHSSES